MKTSDIPFDNWGATYGFTLMLLLLIASFHCFHCFFIGILHFFVFILSPFLFHDTRPALSICVCTCLPAI